MPPSADAEEIHSQITQIWFTADEVGGGLELLFDFGQEYDLTTLHFWNYTAEAFDVDHIAFTFFNQSNDQVGAVEVIPDLGSSPGILAQDFVLAAPINIQFSTAFLTGDNGEVDFQNIGRGLGPHRLHDESGSARVRARRGARAGQPVAAARRHAGARLPVCE